MKVLADFQHESLLRSLVILFEERLGHELYRPIGMEWFEEGFWAITTPTPLETAKQFLAFGSQAVVPSDGTPKINELAPEELTGQSGEYLVLDPNKKTAHRAATLDFFKQHKFDIVIASIISHIEPFRRLIAQYQPQAKLIFQMGNEWPEEYWFHHNVLASVKRRQVPHCNPIFYHQEFDLDVFSHRGISPSKKIYSFINVLQNYELAWGDFQALESSLPDYDFKSYGALCRDGSIAGSVNLAAKMSEAQVIFHVKHGDGFGHIIHNAYALGRPPIVRLRDYKGILAENLLVPGTFFDLDDLGHQSLIDAVRHVTQNPYELNAMSQACVARFKQVVDYDQEAKDIEQWLTTLW